MGKPRNAKTSDVIPLRRLRHLDHAIFGNLVIAPQSTTEFPSYLCDDLNDSLNTQGALKGRRNRIVRSVSFDIEAIERRSREKRERKHRKSAGDVATKPETDDDKLSQLFSRNVDDEDVSIEEDAKRPSNLGQGDACKQNTEKTKTFQRQISAPSKLQSQSPSKVKLTSKNIAKSQIKLSKFEEIDEEFNNGDSTTYVLHKRPAYHQRAFSDSSLRPVQQGVGVDVKEVPATPVTSPTPSRESLSSSRDGSEGTVLSLVGDLLYEIYEKDGCASPSRRRYSTSSVAESDYWSNTSYFSNGNKISGQNPPGHQLMQRARLQAKGLEELRAVHCALVLHVQHSGARLVRNLKRREALGHSRDKKYDVITAYLQAHSEKRMEDACIRFSAMPHPGDSGFAQWHDAMKMVARLPGGIPPDFRRRLWLTLAEKHLEKRHVEWRLAERSCFNEWTNPDDEDLGVQIVKDLHRTGCSLFCGAAAQQNQALLKRVLLGFARWNKSVGYCQGFNMLAALILQVVDRSDSDALKVMIYLIEGVLPESYFANNLRGLSVDMAVFRDLLRLRLPSLSRHLEQLQLDAGDTTTGTSYEPPLTNVFTMQWFLTLFSNCLPQTTVLRVWDLVFLEGNGVLLRTALAIWETLQERIMAVESADEFYSIMGVLTREMLEFGLMDSNNLVKAIVRLPLPELAELRDRHLYDISPWSRPSPVARRLRLFHDDTDDDTDDDDAKLAVAATYGIFRHHPRKRESTSTSLSSLAFSPERDRIASLDISALKQQYSKIRQRQRQAHIILSAACARQPLNVAPAGQVAMNHLLLGKSALMSVRGRRGAPPGAVPPPVVRDKGRRERELRPQPQAKHGHLVTSNSRVTCPQPSSGETLHWKDASSRKPVVIAAPIATPDDAADASDSSSTSTELCDEPDRLSDFDSEPTSLVIDDDDVVKEDAVKECVVVKEEIEKKVRELFRDFSKEDEDVVVDKVDDLVDLTEGVCDDVDNSLKTKEADLLAPPEAAEAPKPVQDLGDSSIKVEASVESFLDFEFSGVETAADVGSLASPNVVGTSKELQELFGDPLKEPFDSFLDFEDGVLPADDADSLVSAEEAGVSTNFEDLFEDQPMNTVERFDTFIDLKNNECLKTKDCKSLPSPDNLTSPKSLLELFGDSSKNSTEVFDSLLELKESSALTPNGLNALPSPGDLKPSKTIQQLPGDQPKDAVTMIVAFADFEDSNVFGTQNGVSISSPDEANTSKNSEELFCDLSQDAKDCLLKTQNSDVVKFESPGKLEGNGTEENFLDFTKETVQPPKDHSLLNLDLQQFVEGSFPPVDGQTVDFVSPHSLKATDDFNFDGSLKSPEERRCYFSQMKDAVFQPNFESEVVSDENMPSASTAPLLELTSVFKKSPSEDKPEETPPSEPFVFRDSLTTWEGGVFDLGDGLKDGANLIVPKDESEKSGDDSFEEFISGRSKSPIRSDSDDKDKKDSLKELVSKLALDLGGVVDVDVTRRPDGDVVRVKEDEPSTPFYKPKDAKELFTIVDTPDDESSPPEALVRSAKSLLLDIRKVEAFSPEDSAVYRKFVFPVVVPSPDEETTAKPSAIEMKRNVSQSFETNTSSPKADASEIDDDNKTYIPATTASFPNEIVKSESVLESVASSKSVEKKLCDAIVQASPLEEHDYFRATPLEVLPLDVLPVGASINLGRRKSERALQLISENSEILSQLTTGRRPGTNAPIEDNVVVVSPRRSLTSKKCPSFDVGTEKVTRMAGFKFHSYSVDGTSSASCGEERMESSTSEDADVAKSSPERGSFDPFPVKRRPKQLGLYSPT